MSLSCTATWLWNKKLFISVLTCSSSTSSFWLSRALGIMCTSLCSCSASQIFRLFSLVVITMVSNFSVVVLPFTKMFLFFFIFLTIIIGFTYCVCFSYFLVKVQSFQCFYFYFVCCYYFGFHLCFCFLSDCFYGVLFSSIFSNQASSIITFVFSPVLDLFQYPSLNYWGKSLPFCWTFVLIFILFWCSHSPILCVNSV